MTSMELVSPVVRVVYGNANNSYEYPPVPVAELLPEGVTDLNYYNDAITNTAKRNELLARAAEWCDIPGQLSGYTITRPDNTFNLLITPKAVFGA